MRPRLALAALALLVCAALPSAAAAADSFTARGATGSGAFTLRLEAGAWKAVPPSDASWVVTASSFHATVYDDMRLYDVSDPLTGKDLLSKDNHTSASYDAGAGTLEVRATAADAVALGLGGSGVPMAIQSQGDMAVAPTPTGVLERSHFYTDQAINTGAGDYEYLNAAGPGAHLALGQLPVGNGIRLYVWGADVTFRAANGDVQAFHTGITTNATPPPKTRHFVHALIDLEGASTIAAREANAYADRITLRGAGSIHFQQAQGTLRQGGGVLRLSGDAHLDAPGASVALAGDAVSLQATTDAPLDAFSGAVVLKPPFPWAQVVAAAVLVAALLVYALPTLRGLVLARGDAPRGAGHLRSEAYAHWAVGAQARDWLRLAVWLEGRAVHNAPTVPDFRTERAILLREAGRPAAALEEHRRAHDLLAADADATAVANNAFQAALAAAELRHDAEALHWLQAAVEADRGVVAEARAHPTLRRLREHPDYGAVVA